MDAIVLSCKREFNLPRVMQGLRRQSLLRDIYVIHNAPSKLKVEGAINFYLDKNFGPRIRHVMANLASTEYVLFIDDDLELMADFSGRIQEAIELSPNSVIGLFGAGINEEAGPKGIYGSGGSYWCVPQLTFTDIAVGRFHICRKEFLTQAIDYFNEVPYEEAGDDIALNLSSQLKTRVPALILPCRKEELGLLPDPEAQWQRKEHVSKRDKIVLDFIRRGWKSSVKKSEPMLVTGGKT